MESPIQEITNFNLFNGRAWQHIMSTPESLPSFFTSSNNGASTRNQSQKRKCRPYFLYYYHGLSLIRKWAIVRSCYVTLHMCTHTYLQSCYDSVIDKLQNMHTHTRTKIKLLFNARAKNVRGLSSFLFGYAQFRFPSDMVSMQIKLKPGIPIRQSAQIYSLRILRSTFLNSIKFVDWGILRIQNCEMFDQDAMTAEVCCNCNPCETFATPKKSVGTWKMHRDDASLMKYYCASLHSLPACLPSSPWVLKLLNIYSTLWRINLYSVTSAVGLSPDRPFPNFRASKSVARRSSWTT